MICTPAANNISRFSASWFRLSGGEMRRAKTTDRRALSAAASALASCVFHLKVITSSAPPFIKASTLALYLTFQVITATMKFTLALGAILATTAAAFAPAAVAPRAVAVSTTAVK
eukprot:scaffold16018_cov120-Skeletonema_dohrnii-CCMP3373.AAC.5